LQGLDERLDRLLASDGDPVVRPVDGLVPVPRPDRPDEHSNFQSRELLCPQIDTSELRVTAGPAADADVWRERLRATVDGRYELLLQVRLAESIGWLAEEQRWAHTTLPNMRFNRTRVREVPEELAAKIRALNWLDGELHVLAVERFPRPG
jgi:hypothetical protein